MIIIGCLAFIALCACGYGWLAYLLMQPEPELTAANPEFWTGAP